MEFLEPVHIGSLTTVSRELAWYKLGLVDVQEFGWYKRRTVRTGDYILCMENGNKNPQLGTGPHDRIKSAVNTVEFVSDMM